MRPFLKWAGNKYRIIERIKEILPEGNQLIEPFAGSVAVFLCTDYQKNLLTDKNADLINLFKQVQFEGQDFIDYCKTFFTQKNNTAKRFYELRDLFNKTQDVRLKSALFIYLNRHGFNGLCRYNQSGKFNVPFGRYKKPFFPTDALFHFHEKSRYAVFKQADFSATLKKAVAGDVVYCDPPYVPISPTASFTNYSAGGFNAKQQQQLAKQAEKLVERGVTVIISNHHTPLTEQLYQRAKITTFDVRRTISCQGNTRNKAKELLAVYRPG